MKKQTSKKKNKSNNKPAAMKSEAIIFFENIIAKGEIKNYSFERLKYIEGHMMDFYCEELRAVIDIVPSLTKRSMNEEVKKNLKQKEFRKLGYSVFTFTDEEILNQPEKIEGVLIDLIKKQTIPYNLHDPAFLRSDEGWL